MVDVKYITLDTLARMLRYPTTIGKDSPVAVTGEEGEGKSGAVLFKLAPKINPKFDLWRHVLYTEYEAEFKEKYEFLEPYQCWVIDEAIKIMYKMDFMLAGAKDLVKSYAADMRKEKHAIHFMLIPDFDDLMKYFREKRVKFWIELLPREQMANNELVGMCFQKPRVPFKPATMDIWFLKDYFEKFIKTYKRYGYNDKLIDLMRGHPYYVGEVLFKAPSSAQYDRYLRLREHARNLYTPNASEEAMTMKQQKWRLFALRVTRELVKSGKYNVSDLVSMGKNILSDNAISAALKKLRDD